MMTKECMSEQILQEFASIKQKFLTKKWNIVLSIIIVLTKHTYWSIVFVVLSHRDVMQRGKTTTSHPDKYRCPTEYGIRQSESMRIITEW